MFSEQGLIEAGAPPAQPFPRPILCSLRLPGSTVNEFVIPGSICDARLVMMNRSSESILENIRSSRRRRRPLLPEAAPFHQQRAPADRRWNNRHSMSTRIMSSRSTSLTYLVCLALTATQRTFEKMKLIGTRRHAQRIPRTKRVPRMSWKKSRKMLGSRALLEAVAEASSLDFSNVVTSL